jgi:hypothetical protein
MKKQLILVPSERMDSNKKKDRYEDKLIRLSAKARESLGLNDEKVVELWPSNSATDRINRSKTLNIFKAYSVDLKKLKENGLSTDEYERVGFVTTRTFEYICGNGANSQKDIWVSQSIDDTVIGGDPEFILINGDGSVQYAGYVDDFGHNGKLASDGPLAEIRPDPTITAEDFVNDIQRILCTHPRRTKISDYEWMATCCWLGGGDDYGHHKRYEWPVGGHIHVGTPAQIAEQNKKSILFERSFYVALTKVLDELLAIPAMKLDKKDECIKRRTQYGKYGSYRTDHGRLEYRTLSGMWMAHPKLALTILGTAKAIIDSFFHLVEAANFQEDFLNGGQDPRNINFFDPRFNGWDRIEIMKAMSATRSSKEMSDILNNHNFQYTKEYIKKLRATLMRLPTYKNYAKHIDTLVEIISLPHQKLRTIDCDLKHTWVANKEFIV